MGDLVTGEPVSRRRYRKSEAILTRALVLLALWFLMVVDSSMPTRPRCPNFLPSHSPACLPLSAEKASTFMTKMVRPPKALPTDLISASCCLLADETQRITRFSISSGMCSGISLATQLRYTPFGAMIKAKSILPSRCRFEMVSIRTFDFPVPISMKKP